jgi:hypothetical protein
MKGNLQNFWQRRGHRFGLDMIVIGVCFGLYYLGFFGSVAGPLHPAQIGDNLVRWGVTKAHLLIFFICLALAAICWNWLFNLACYLQGRRLTCNQNGPDGVCCNAPAVRIRSIHKKTGAVVHLYRCSQGHRRNEAHFHPVKKGMAGHTIAAIAFIFCVIVWYVAYAK